MASLQGKAYTRVTLALDIVRRLSDGPRAGFHELSTVKHQIELHDTVRVADGDETRVSCADPAVPCDERNICVRAVRLLQRCFHVDRQVHIEIEKRIPVMGGLAGGSANAAVTLALVAKLWGLKPGRGRLMALGRQLGMDVPYYFVGGSAHDREAVSAPERIETSLVMDVVLVVPTFGVSTRDAYASIDYAQIGHRRAMTDAMCRALVRSDVAAVASCVHNDFELSVFARCPRLRELSGRLRRAGSEAVCMSGSGSTLLGLAASPAGAQAIARELSGQPDVRAVIVSRSCAAAPGA